MENQTITIHRNNGTEARVTVRSAGPQDRQALQAMYQSVPDREAVCFIDDIRHPVTIAKWFEPNDLLETLSLIAETDGRIIGEAAIVRRRASRVSHVGDLRIFIHPSWRRLGIGPRLISALFTEAIKIGIEKITISIPEPADPNFSTLLEKTGFSKEAALKNHYRAIDGSLQSIFIYGRDLEDLWHRISDWLGNFGRAMEY